MESSHVDGEEQGATAQASRHAPLGLGPRLAETTSHDLASRSLIEKYRVQTVSPFSPTRTMQYYGEDNPILLYVVGLATLSLFYVLFRRDPEAAVPYNVTPPEEIAPGWKGEVLDNLSMKVLGTIPLRI